MNSSTAATTAAKGAVEAAASHDRYGRSWPSTQGTSAPSPTSLAGNWGTDVVTASPSCLSFRCPTSSYG